ncbi:MAG: DUF4465 domain-containing protein [Planctomycetia bacterium]|nr:DUF4465 domain-containing protein [Planctomycetia bacterium]
MFDNTCCNARHSGHLSVWPSSPNPLWSLCLCGSSSGSWLRRVVALVVAWSLNLAPAFGGIVDFEDLTLPPESFYNGSDNAGQFQSGGATFNNSFTDFGGGFTAWEGFAYSNVTDNTTPGFGNQYSAYPGSGSRGSANYGVGFTNTFVLEAPIVALPAGIHPISLRVTNDTYAALSMRDGDSFAKKFGGPTGNDPDWFKLSITGRDAAHQPIATVDFYLADYRFANSALDYVVGDWRNVNLASLYDARELVFALSSTDNGTFGMNTPAYFALDDLSLAKFRGDVNDSGLVDISDINAIAANWLQAGPVADANGDGLVDISDVQTVAANWLAGSGADAAVPEPGTGGLALAALAFCAFGWLHCRDGSRRARIDPCRRT